MRSFIALLLSVMRRFWATGAVGLAALLSACSTVPPEGLHAVTRFDVQRYQGTWYEIARLDHSFERNMTDVSARYTVQADGSVQVVNRGFNTLKNEWKQAVGKALFTGDTDRGSLKVSFFGPFYGGYHVVALDPQYRWSMVVGPDFSLAHRATDWGDAHALNQPSASVGTSSQVTTRHRISASGAPTRVPAAENQAL